MKKILVLILVIGTFFSCYNLKKSVKQTNRSANEYPDTTRSILRARWPVVITGTKKDSTDYKKYLADIKALQDYYEAYTPDTVYFPSDEKEIETWEDSTKIKALKKDLSNANFTINRKDAAYAQLLEKCKTVPAIRDTIFQEDKELSAGYISKANKSEKSRVKANKWKNVFKGLAIGSGIAFLITLIILIVVIKKKK